MCNGSRDIKSIILINPKDIVWDKNGDFRIKRKILGYPIEKNG